MESRVIHPLPTRRRIARFIAILAFPALLAAGWCARPYFYLATVPFLEPKGDEDGLWLRDGLVACGPSAIDPVIASIRKGTAMVRNTAYLPQVLHGLGEPAHRQLLASIDAESDVLQRNHLIHALQRGFEDYSRFDLWLAHPSHPSTILSYAMESDLQLSFPDAPPLYLRNGNPPTTRELNPAFLEWWKARQTPSQSRGRFSAIRRCDHVLVSRGRRPAHWWRRAGIHPHLLLHLS